MPGFDYLAVHADGRRARGRATAVNAAALVDDLASQGLTVLRCDERRETPSLSGGVSAAALADAARALASLLPAGLSFTAALDVVAASSPPALAGVLRDVRARVERGETVASSMAAHPRIFGAAVIGVVRAGERAGDLDGAFDRLARQLERDQALRERLVSAAIYPAVLAVAGGAAILVLLLMVLPRFAALFEGTGLALPASTAFLLGAATAVRAHWTVLPIIAVLMVALAAWLRQAPAGRLLLARVLLAMPLVGAFRRDLLGARTARTLSVLLRGGTPLAGALDDAAMSSDDPVVREALQRVRARVVAGSALHAAMSAEDVFAPVFVALVSTGEAAGRLADFLERAADLFEQRTARGAQRLVALAEPAMIIVFGVLVGFIALSLLQAIYGINPAGLR